MKNRLLSMCLVTTIALSVVVSVEAQSVIPTERSEQCDGPIYQGNQIPQLQKARITVHPSPVMTSDAINHNLRGVVILEGVLCRTGKVTDVTVIKGLPYGMTEQAIQSVHRTRFVPAEMNWHSVSQKMRFEFHFNDSGIEEIAPESAIGKTVEEIEILGWQRIQSSEIMQHVRTQLGSPYDQSQVKKDLDAILATGFFDKANSRVVAEEGVRGGVVVIFELRELPRISAVSFTGLTMSEQSRILKELLNAHLEIKANEVYNEWRISQVVAVIKRVLEADGWNTPSVELRTELLTAGEAALTFVIRKQQ